MWYKTYRAAVNVLIVRTTMPTWSRVWWRGLAAVKHPAGREEVWVSASPRVCLHDVPTTLQAGGLQPNTPVTFFAHLTDEKGRLFGSHAHYVTDDGGGVDLGVASSEGGSYTGVFPPGLLTTLTSSPQERQFPRLVRQDPQLPWRIRVSVVSGHQPLWTQTEVLAEVELERHLMAPGVRRIPVRHGRVRGTLYLPPGNGPFPGIFDIYGMASGLIESRSAMFASRGIASLALAYFGYEDLPKTTDEIDLAYFEEAMQLLLSWSEVIPDRCGAVANCKSGDIAFTLATLMEPMKAIVGINPCIMVLHSRFMYRGKLYKQGFRLEDQHFRYEDGKYWMDLESCFYKNRQEIIPVEDADDDTHFLVIAGEDDPWGFKGNLTPFRERMRQHGKRNFETVLYPGAGHIIEPPYAPHIRHCYQSHLPWKEGGCILKWGGKPQPTCEAQVDLWRRMQTFIMTHVRDKSPWYQDCLSERSSATRPTTGDP